MIVGNLWDVTDKDIDKFSLSLFEKWGLSNEDENYRHKTTNICDAVRESRDSCNLRYLNGAAPVVYGLPLSLL
jgi:regulator of sirC expression with transglutaminase-like and TPR domain